MAILAGDQGYTGHRIPVLPDAELDCSTAIFRMSNDGSAIRNQYPLDVRAGPAGAVIRGGQVFGEIAGLPWRDLYDVGNSSSVRAGGNNRSDPGIPGVVIRDWMIDGAWDGIRVSWGCPDFVVERCYLRDMADDAFENDRLQSGTYRNILVDGAFAGLSVDPSSSSPVDGSGNTVVLDNVLIRLAVTREYEKYGLVHASFIKTDSTEGMEVTPALRCRNVTFALTVVDHRSYRSMREAYAKMGDTSEGCWLLNLTDTPLADAVDDYPMPPTGWTVLEGAEARAKWAAQRDAWLAAWNGEPEEPPVDPIDASAEVAAVETALAALKTKLGY